MSAQASAEPTELGVPATLPSGSQRTEPAGSQEDCSTPMQRTESGVPAAASAAASGGEASSVCVECGSPAAVWCHTCTAELCAQHSAEAHKLRLQQGHKLMPISDKRGYIAALEAEAMASRLSKCSVHDGAAKSFFCVAHLEACCGLCRLEGEKHYSCPPAKVVKIAQAVQAVKADQASMMSRIDIEKIEATGRVLLMQQQSQLHE
jgi:hypothetical protein